jgi:WXXGXW repeat (2 copies)
MPRQLTRLLRLAAAGAVLFSAASVVAGGITIDIGIGTPPQLVVVPGSSVYYAPDVPVNYFFYQGRYYTLANGAWFTAPVYNGPWAVIQIGQVPPPVLAVPVEYYKIPPGHLKKPGPPPWAGHGQKKKAKHHGHGHKKE